MAYSSRIIVFSSADEFICDIDPACVTDAPYVNEINGEHSLTFVMGVRLEKTNRLLMQDGMEVWYEYVVLGVSEGHADGGGGMLYDHYCVWSLQYDTMGTYINSPYGCGVVPGHASVPQSARTALGVALGGTSRWTIGTVTVTTTSAASFYRRSGWDGLKTVTKHWGGELQATIEVDSEGVVSRTVDLLAHIGSSTASRRFDYGGDLSGIRRIISDEVWACRMVPLGKSTETEAGGYSRRPSIEDVNDGVPWLQNDEVVEYTRVLAPDGSYEYPTVIVENDTYEDPAELRVWAQENLESYTMPKVTYEATLLQYEKAGLNPHGIALGDEIVVVDNTWPNGGLRISSRVIRYEGNLVNETDVRLTIGNAKDTLASQIGSLSRRVSDLGESVATATQYQVTSDYLSNLIARLNNQANATGGYTYITEGEGLRTYDMAVSDPLVGTEAGQVTDMRGGLIRIANSRTASGDWDWQTLIESGRIAANMVVGGQIVSGYIRSADGSFYIDLDSNVINISPSATSVGDMSLEDAINDAKRYATDYLHYESGELTLGTTDSAVKNVLTSSRQTYRTAAGDIAWYGLDDAQNIWKLFIDNAQINDMLQFGDFAWIARQNGNMTIKWIGD